MIGISLRHLPAWAHWVAQDADGAWWAYEAEPLMFGRGWYENEVGRQVRLGDGAANPDWRDSLRRVAPGRDLPELR
jgi:hypothetical protein